MITICSFILLKLHHKNNSFLCNICNKNLASKFSLHRHKTVCKKRDENLINVNLPSIKQYNCNKCNKKF